MYICIMHLSTQLRWSPFLCWPLSCPHTHSEQVSMYVCMCIYVYIPMDVGNGTAVPSSAAPSFVAASSFVACSPANTHSEVYVCTCPCMCTYLGALCGRNAASSKLRIRPERLSFPSRLSSPVGAFGCRLCTRPSHLHSCLLCSWRVCLRFF